MADRPMPRRFPLLFQLNARTTVRTLGPRATLDDLDDAALDRLLPLGIDWLYLLGVWQTGPASRAVSQHESGIRQDCLAALPDATDEDIAGSCFAVTAYRVHEHLGGDESLARLRTRLAARGIHLMLDFVPNHTALDHPWVTDHPDRYIEGTPDDLASAPDNWTQVGHRVLAYGRDPYFAGWSDTLQLDYSQPALQAAMRAELLAAASRCDGLRCDMAMLLLPDVFERTWARTAAEFWPDALDGVRARHPGFTFMAEVYWDREYDLQQRGFDFTYDKRLYDRLVGDLAEVRGHLCADGAFQARSARFLENHDEPRAATTFGTGDRHRAAGVITYLSPGLRFVQHGQREASRIHVPMHLSRAPIEPDRQEVADFYDQLFGLLADESILHDGSWRLLESVPAWDGNASAADVIGATWSTVDGPPRFLTVVNLSDTASQAYLRLPCPGLAGRTWTFDDQLGPERYERVGDDLLDHGLYVDLRAWGHNVFRLDPAAMTIVPPQ